MRLIRLLQERKGEYINHALAPEVIDELHNPMDLPQKGTRELTAEDFVYSIKRMANPRIIAPVYGTMVNYLPGLKDFAVQVRAEDKRLRADLKPSDRDLPFLDLRKLSSKVFRRRISTRCGSKSKESTRSSPTGWP